MIALLRNSLMVFCTFALLALSSCNSNSLEDYPYSNYATVEPKIEDVTGTWVPDAPTLKDMTVRGGYTTSSSQLTLNSDGTYSMMNLPDWLLESKQGRSNVSHHSFFSASGKWHFEKFQDWWAIVFDSNSLTQDSHFGLVAYVCYDNPSHLLHFVLNTTEEGDDGEEAARFQKQ